MSLLFGSLWKQSGELANLHATLFTAAQQPDNIREAETSPQTRRRRALAVVLAGDAPPEHAAHAAACLQCVGLHGLYATAFAKAGHVAAYMLQGAGEESEAIAAGAGAGEAAAAAGIGAALRSEATVKAVVVAAAIEARMRANQVDPRPPPSPPPRPYLHMCMQPHQSANPERCACPTLSRLAQLALVSQVRLPASQQADVPPEDEMVMAEPFTALCRRGGADLSAPAAVLWQFQDACCFAGISSCAGIHLPPPRPPGADRGDAAGGLGRHCSCPDGLSKAAVGRADT